MHLKIIKNGRAVVIVLLSLIVLTFFNISQWFVLLPDQNAAIKHKLRIPREKQLDERFYSVSIEVSEHLNFVYKSPEDYPTHPFLSQEEQETVSKLLGVEGTCMSEDECSTIMKDFREKVVNGENYKFDKRAPSGDQTPRTSLSSLFSRDKYAEYYPDPKITLWTTVSVDSLVESVVSLGKIGGREDGRTKETVFLLPQVARNLDLPEVQSLVVVVYGSNSLIGGLERDTRFTTSDGKDVFIIGTQYEGRPGYARRYDVAAHLDPSLVGSMIFSYDDDLCFSPEGIKALRRASIEYPGRLAGSMDHSRRLEPLEGYKQGWQFKKHLLPDITTTSTGDGKCSWQRWNDEVAPGTNIQLASNSLQWRDMNVLVYKHFMTDIYDIVSTVINGEDMVFGFALALLAPNSEAACVVHERTEMKKGIKSASRLDSLNRRKGHMKTRSNMNRLLHHLYSCRLNGAAKESDQHRMNSCWFVNCWS